MAHTIDNTLEFKALTAIQSHYDKLSETDYTNPAPEANSKTDNPFIDNGQSLDERFHSGEEISMKLDYLIKIAS